VYTIQSAFLEGLGQLIRLHFAITGEFDYNTPFVISMRFPAEDFGEEKMAARTASIDLASSIVEMLQGVLGLEEGEALPEDVVSSILGKYTFLDPTDLTRWIRLSAIQKSAAENAQSEDSEEEGMDGFEGGGGEDDADMVEDVVSSDDGGGADEGLEESTKAERAYFLKTKKLLQEKKKRLREQVLRERYNKAKDELFMHFCESMNFSEWEDPARGHGFMTPKIQEDGPFGEYFKIASSMYSRKGDSNRLRENEVIDFNSLEKYEIENLKEEKIKKSLMSIQD
jgi:hypothetical protein